MPGIISAAETGSWSPSYGRLAVTQALEVQCRDAKDADGCAKVIEHHQAGQGRFKRSGDLLTVLIPGGRHVALFDVPIEKVGTIPDDKISRYGYIEFLPSIGQHLVHVSGYEGTQFLLVDAETGAKTRIFGVPMPSPGGKRLALRFVNYAIDARRIEVWARSAHGFEKEWVHDTTWVPGEPEWLTADTFRVKRVGEGESGFEIFSLSRSGWVEKAKP